MDYRDMPPYDRVPDSLFEIPIYDFSLPIVELSANAMFSLSLWDKGIKVYLALGFMVPPGNIKRIPASYMIQRATETGVFDGRNGFVEPSSGNTASAMAYEAKARGLNFTAIVSDNTPEGKLRSIKRKGATILKESEAKALLGCEGTVSAVDLAKCYAEKFNYAFLNQYENPWNPESFYKLVGPSLWEHLEEKIQVFGAALGTGGTLCGIGRYLKEQDANIKVVAAYPYSGQEVGGTRTKQRWNLGLPWQDVVDVKEETDAGVATDAVRTKKLSALGIFAGDSSKLIMGAVDHFLLNLADQGTLDALRTEDGTIGVLIPFADSIYLYEEE